MLHVRVNGGTEAGAVGAGEGGKVVFFGKPGEWGDHVSCRAGRCGTEELAVEVCLPGGEVSPGPRWGGGGKMGVGARGGRSGTSFDLGKGIIYINLDLHI